MTALALELLEVESVDGDRLKQIMAQTHRGELSFTLLGSRFSHVSR